MLTLWFRPAAAILLWIAVAASTLAELTTVNPSLRAAAYRGDSIHACSCGSLT